MEFEITTNFYTTPEEIYTAWLTSESHSEMTGGEANITDQVGEEFTAWDGYITGKNLELDLNEKIVQSWRTSEFTEYEEDSTFKILLKEKGTITELTLIHSNLPPHGAQYRQGWEDNYFEPMRKFFARK